MLLRRNPLDDIANTQTIAGVVANGRYTSAEGLQELKDVHARRPAITCARDFDQAVYMEVRRSGIDGARRLYPDPLHDSFMVVEPSNLVRFSQVLMDAGVMNEARKVLEWNVELFPDDVATRSRLDALPTSSVGSSTDTRTPAYRFRCVPRRVLTRR